MTAIKANKSLFQEIQEYSHKSDTFRSRLEIKVKPTCSKLGDLQSSICGPLVSPVSKNTFDVCCLDFGERGAREYGSIDPSRTQQVVYEVVISLRHHTK